MGANQFYQFAEFLDSIDSKAIQAILKKAKNSKMSFESLRNRRGLSFIEALGIIQIDVLKARNKLLQKRPLR